jgi:hypothetical protein
MTDIVKELRATAYDKDNFPRMKSEWACSVELALKAADEIQRLRHEVEDLDSELYSLYYSLSYGGYDI